jgi:hypothetical protein
MVLRFFVLDCQLQNPQDATERVNQVVPSPTPMLYCSESMGAASFCTMGKEKSCLS